MISYQKFSDMFRLTLKLSSGCVHKTKHISLTSSVLKYIRNVYLLDCIFIYFNISVVKILFYMCNLMRASMQAETYS